MVWNQYSDNPEPGNEDLGCFIMLIVIIGLIWALHSV
jgi:hypothetical protein